MAVGKKTGGRQKGTKNRSTLEREALMARVSKNISDGIEPLEVMMHTMRQAWQQEDYETAITIAEKAAPYRHPKLASVQHSGDADNPLETVMRVELFAAEDDDSPDCTAPQVAPGLFRSS